MLSETTTKDFYLLFDMPMNSETLASLLLAVLSIPIGGIQRRKLSNTIGNITETTYHLLTEDASVLDAEALLTQTFMIL